MAHTPPKFPLARRTHHHQTKWEESDNKRKHTLTSHTRREGEWDGDGEQTTHNPPSYNIDMNQAASLSDAGTWAGQDEFSMLLEKHGTVTPLTRGQKEQTPAGSAPHAWHPPVQMPVLFAGSRRMAT